MENIPQPHCISEKVWLVPCILNTDSNIFVPLFKPFNYNICFDSQFRNTWQTVEDKILQELVDKYGIKHWKIISKELNKSVYKGISIRNSKQCRERWINHVNPSLNKAKWTESEDVYILENQIQFGNKWSEIARGMNGRTENAVKNRWKCLANKAKKIFKNSPNSVAEYLKQKKEGNNSESKAPRSKSNQGFFPMVSFSDIGFSNFAERFRSVDVALRTPPVQDISPSSLLFFNS
ncbi:hypothetical protein SteCoe_33842 [Stentor coeruleus]|uniref:Myb-like DNA-binding domain containing protein n=1 Tax=Stentor coeruleus TaxID=5963 RepID=A0A1R2AVT2_9CILI|nr:hypothetical protein SteCoe_33842 [Stentor coeruleus]